MPELRKDPITNRWVIIATDRARRPSDYRKQVATKQEGVCPFCPGNESMTPAEIFSYRQADTEENRKGWWLRVVPNRFPALQRDAKVEREGEGIYDMMSGFGIHDLIIETPDHEATLGTMPRFYVAELISGYKQEMERLSQSEGIRYALVFRNFGKEAGASLSHPHSQVIGLPVVPKRLREELEAVSKYYEAKERCLYCDILHQEKREEGVRIVFENDLFVGICPYSSRFPFESHIYPKKHSSSFHTIDALGKELLAEALQQILARLEDVLQNPPYNIVVHTAPFLWKVDCSAFYHWRMEILPRITSAAGFEWATGFYINPTPPEEAARYLKKAMVFTPREAKDVP